MSSAHAAEIGSYCSNGRQAGANGGGDARLDAASATAERDLLTGQGQTGAADAVLTTLGKVAAEEPAASAAALSRFCLAAGEAARYASQGSPEQAKRLFLQSYRLSGAQRDVGAIAAYRLSLLSLSGSSTGVRGAARGMRGAVRGMRRGQSDTSQPSTGAIVPAEGCAAFDGDDASSITGSNLTIAALRCAADSAAAAGDQALATRAQVRLSRVLLSLSQRRSGDEAELREMAANTAREALQASESIALPGSRLGLTAAAFEAALDAGVEAAGITTERDWLLGASADSEPILRARALAAAARFALVTGQRDDAAALLRQAIQTEAAAPPVDMPRLYLLLAEAEPARRAAHIRAAFHALGAVRPILPRFDPITDESSFTTQVQPVFEALVELMLPDQATTMDAATIKAVQEVVEEYRQAEIQSLLGRDCVPTSLPLKESELRSGEILLYPLLLPDRVELIYAVGSDDGTARYVRLPPNTSADRREVTTLTATMVRSIAYDGDDAWEAASRRLYDILIAPIAAKLSPETTLVLIPGQELGALPFAALRDKDGRFLIERTRLAVVPALAYSQPGAAHGRTEPTVLAAGLGKEVDLPAGKFPALAGTLSEVRAIALEGVPSGHRNIVLENFDHAALVKALQGRRIDILHLATHASFNGGSDRSFIVSDGDIIPMAELRGMIGRNATRGDLLDLLILSACETAVGDDEQSLGLAGAAIQAGAKSAIASLWEVNDTGTVELMKAFYANYRRGDGKSAALRDAQLAMIARGGDLADPIVWASFTLLGGWR
ncbi:CHAT domain-containing protein [Novosphingobium sp. G106]|uniref:CHAT domain-containing protein n=1 Tax=Novosphingobium sp. G106 TaxID=2849500 RepID=UPI001C2CFAF3|nr:CHAT domain-containing protein [Novosphingobium sp. G106]MBV1688805.1 CHAT domain-containing protein [Novosphingobium sp. G106]